MSEIVKMPRMSDNMTKGKLKSWKIHDRYQIREGDWVAVDNLLVIIGSKGDDIAQLINKNKHLMIYEKSKSTETIEGGLSNLFDTIIKKIYNSFTK